MIFVRQIAKNSLDFLGYSNLFLALAVAFSTLQGGFIFNYASRSAVHFSLVNFIAAFFLYNLQRIYQSSLPTTDSRLLWYRKNKKWIFTISILLVLVFAGRIWDIFMTFKEGVVVYGVCALLSILYFLPPFNLRKIPCLKQFFIALVWVMVCIVIPFLFQASDFIGLDNFDKNVWLYIASQFCFIAALCIPFDIRDMEKDKEEGTKSLPVVLGLQKSKIAAIILLIIYLVLAFFIDIKSLVGIRGIVFLVSVAAVYFSNPSRHRYYFIFFVEGIIVLQTILLYNLL